MTLAYQRARRRTGRNRGSTRRAMRPADTACPPRRLVRWQRC